MWTVRHVCHNRYCPPIYRWPTHVQDGVYRPVTIENRVVDLRTHYDWMSVPLCCVDEHGKVARCACAHVMLFLLKVGAEHNIIFKCYQCEPLPVTMVRARIWPAFPHHPKLAFTFWVFGLGRSISPGVSNSVEGFALYFKCPQLGIYAYNCWYIYFSVYNLCRGKTSTLLS